MVTLHTLDGDRGTGDPAADVKQVRIVPTPLVSVTVSPLCPPQIGTGMVIVDQR